MCYQGCYTLLITESEKVGKFTWYETRESDMEGLELIRISTNFFFFLRKQTEHFFLMKTDGSIIFLLRVGLRDG